MSEKKGFWPRVYQVSALLIVVVFLAFAGANLYEQIPLLHFASDTAWDTFSMIDKVNASTNGRVLGFGTFLSTHGEILNLLGKRESGGFESVKDADGRLVAADFLPYNANDYSSFGIALNDISEIVQEHGGHLLFVNPIDRSIGAESGDSGFPLENHKYRYDAIDFFLQGFEIPYLNLNDMLAAETDNPQSLRYRTDSRWTIETSFDAFGKIVTAVDEIAGVNLDPDGQYTDLSNYQQTTYEQQFLGNLGRRTGAPFGGYDDFTLIVPDFPTSLTMTTNYFDREAITSGDFSQVLLMDTYLEADDEYDRAMYATYLGGNAAQRIIKNELNPYGPKVLVIGDSYLAPIVAFLTSGSGEVHYLWQYENPVVEDLSAYLAEEAFDVVLIGMSSNMMGEGGFGFLNNLE